MFQLLIAFDSTHNEKRFFLCAGEPGAKSTGGRSKNDCRAAVGAGSEESHTEPAAAGAFGQRPHGPNPKRIRIMLK